MSKKRKIIVISIFVAIVIVAGAIAAFLNVRDTQEGVKNFHIEIISERDAYHETTAIRSELDFLGEYLRIMDGCQYDDSGFGLFVEGFYGMEQDFGEEYWWGLSVDGEDAMVGADDIPLHDGSLYTFTLMKGF